MIGREDWMGGQGLGLGVGEDLVKYVAVIGNVKVRWSEVSFGHCDLWVWGGHVANWGLG